MSAKEQPAEAATTSARGLKGGALGFVASTGMGIASTAPAYSLAATLGFVVATVGPQTLLLVPLAFIPMFFSARTAARPSPGPLAHSVRRPAGTQADGARSRRTCWRWRASRRSPGSTSSC
jgi:hypothetical protein